MIRIVPLATVLAAAFALPAAADEFVYFRTPSGNIHCAWYDVDGTPEVRCDIGQYKASFSRPSDCELDYGFAFAVRPKSKKGVVLCAGDTVADPNAGVLAYGQSFSRGGLTCVSATSGLSCTNKKGHGFSLSKAKQRVF